MPTCQRPNWLPTFYRCDGSAVRSLLGLLFADLAYFMQMLNKIKDVSN